MKVKIRGLVFAGFAAAVFAQSALAVGADDKTVTSKTYVDTYFQNLNQRDSTTGEYPNDVTSIDEGSTNTEYPTSRNVYKFVTSTVNSLNSSLNITGDPTKHTDRVTVYEEGYENNPDHITGYKIIVPDAAVAGTGAAIGGDAQNPGPADGTDLTTAQAVYDFVNGGDGTGFQRKLTSSENPSLGVYNADGTSVWRAAQGGTYVTMDTSGTGAITFDVPQSQTARKGADDTTTQGVNENEIVAGSYKLATANAVYEFVVGDPDDPNSGFQPKATAVYAGNGVSTPSNKQAQVGIIDGSGVSTWYGLAAGQDGRTLGTNQQDVPYARVYRDNGATTSNAGVYIDVDHSRVMLASTYTGNDFQKGIDSVTNNVEGPGLALATAGAVKEYVDSITNGNSLPVMPPACEAANVHCALVTNYATTAVGTQGESDYHPAGSTWLEWTVMAVTQ